MLLQFVHFFRCKFLDEICPFKDPFRDSEVFFIRHIVTGTVFFSRLVRICRNFCLPFTFRRAVTVQSFVLRGFTAAEEKIFLTLEEAQALIPEK